jgi:5-methylcytosine-specific restriction endonuclease McrA
MSAWTPEKSLARKERRKSRKLRLLELLGGKCERCGSTENLEFDHLKPSQKKFIISKFIDRADSNLLDEVNKCQLLCKTCHHEKTLEKQEYGKLSAHGTIWRYKKYKCRCKKCTKAMKDYYEGIKSLKGQNLISFSI